MWPIVGYCKEKIIWSVDFIFIELFTRIFEYVIGPDWNYSQLQIYWIE